MIDDIQRTLWATADKLHANMDKAKAVICPVLGAPTWFSC